MPRLSAIPTDRTAARRRRLVRALAAAWLSLYVLAVGAGPLMDALSGHGQGGVAHWEDASGDRCPQRHDEMGCQFGPLIAGAGHADPPPAVLVASWRLKAQQRPAEAESLHGTAQRTVPPSRGPPAA